MRLGAVCLCLLCASAIAEVHVWFEPRIVDELDSITLNLRASDTRVADAPDLSVLETDFEILGSQTTSQRRSVNGNVESWVDYQYTLRPKRSGEITIPPIRVGNQISAPTQVIVRALDPNVKQSIQRMVFFETELSVNPVYVQAQTIFIRRLYYANGVQLYSDLPGVPDVANAVIVPLGETQSGSTLVDGTRYGVIEQRFAIFPEQSGMLSIPESAITSSVRVRRDGRTRRSGIRIRAPAQTLRVLPIPPEYPAGATWLPATDVRLLETWSPKRNTFNLGDPITRSIAVTAVGNTGSAIPPLQVDFPQRHFKHYPESPVLDDDASGDQVVGTRREAYSLIPTAPGSVQLAAVTLTWWDTNTRTVRTASLPPRSLSLQGSVPQSASQTANNETPEATSSLPSANPPAASKDFPFAPLLALACLTLAALSIWRWRGGLPQRRASNSPADTLPSRRKAMRELKSACAAQQYPQVRKRLLHALKIIYAKPQAQALALFLAKPEHAGLWQRLNAAAYGPNQAGTVDANLGKELWHTASRLKAPRGTTAQDPLPPLYSSGA